ncbi:hypothetical protein [Bartonella doshiae]|uniref:hypothetical protein n=1 Tax=Bartonella doshiae TaxID=33044 RepID=UPI000941FF94|nr:hypothetical protein [Bartonella doshiae]
MFKSNILCIFITVIFCFLQIVKVNANLGRSRSQESLFIATTSHEKDILVETKNMVIIRISDQNTIEKSGSTIGEKVKKGVMIATITFFLAKLALKGAILFETWAIETISKAFNDW